jgi:hypothetical protein
LDSVLLEIPGSQTVLFMHLLISMADVEQQKRKYNCGSVIMERADRIDAQSKSFICGSILSDVVYVHGPDCDLTAVPRRGFFALRLSTGS